MNPETRRRRNSTREPARRWLAQAHPAPLAKVHRALAAYEGADPAAITQYGLGPWSHDPRRFRLLVDDLEVILAPLADQTQYYNLLYIGPELSHASAINLGLVRTATATEEPGRSSGDRRT